MKERGREEMEWEEGWVRGSVRIAKRGDAD
jgi:hypothetical protein